MTPNATINVSVSSHYRESSYNSELVSQGLLGERVEILEEGESFTKICQKDDYVSWLSSDQVTAGNYQNGNTACATSHFLRIYEQPTIDSDGINDAVIGCRLSISDENENWYRLVLPDGKAGWAEKKHFGSFPDFSPKNIVTLANQFMGYQYLWGGVTPKGFDCSGFIQTVFAMHNIILPRDSWQQQKKHVISTDFRDAKPADLLFFAKTPERVTHVAIALGDGKFIHASGLVQKNSLALGDRNFCQKRFNTFVSVNRYGQSGEI